MSTIHQANHKASAFTWFVHFPLTGYVLKGPPKTPNEIYSTAIREMNHHKHSIWSGPRDKIRATGGMVIAINAPLNDRKAFRAAVERELFVQLRACHDKHFSIEQDGCVDEYDDDDDDACSVTTEIWVGDDKVSRESLGQ